MSDALSLAHASTGDDKTLSPSLLAALEERGERGVVAAQRLGHGLGERQDHLAVEPRLDLVLAVADRLQLRVSVHRR